MASLQRGGRLGVRVCDWCPPYVPFSWESRLDLRGCEVITVRWWVLALIGIVALAGYPPANAQPARTMTFTATGRAMISSGNINLAQQRALQNALWLAADMAVDTIVASGARAESASEIRAVLSTPSKFISTYTVTQRGPTRGQFVVTVQAVVQMTTLATALQARGVALRPEAASPAGSVPAPARPAATPVPTPRPLVLMVVIPETMLGRTGVPDPAAETQLIKRLIDAGYKVVEQKEVAQVRDTPPVQQIWGSPTQPLTQSFGNRYRADVLVVGQAFSEAIGPAAVPPPPAQPGAPPPAPVGGPTLISARARVQVRVIVAATGRVVASESATASAVDVGEVVAAKEALSKAADLVADAILPRIAALQAPPVAQAPPAAQPAAPPAPAVQPPAPAVTPAPSPAAPGQADRLRIALLPFQLGFTNPSWAQQWDISLGVTETLEEALFASGRYRVIERRALDAVLREQGIGRTGAVDAATAARLGRVLGVQSLVAGTVNQFELKGAGGIALPVVLLAFYQAQVQLTARVIDTTTGEILGIARGTGRAEGMMALAAFQGVAFGGAEFDKTVLGRALDQAIQDLVAKLGALLGRQ